MVEYLLENLTWKIYPIVKRLGGEIVRGTVATTFLNQDHALQFTDQCSIENKKRQIATNIATFLEKLQ